MEEKDLDPITRRALRIGEEARKLYPVRLALAQMKAGEPFDASVLLEAHKAGLVILGPRILEKLIDFSRAPAAEQLDFTLGLEPEDLDFSL